MTNEMIEKLEAISAMTATLHDNITEFAPTEILETQSFAIYRSLCDLINEIKGV